MKIVIVLLMWMGNLCAGLQNANLSIVFVHAGQTFPSHLEVSLQQARLFNSCPIVLIANKDHLDRRRAFLADNYITGIACEELPKQEEHKAFIARSKLDKEFREGFWYYASERFFYLDDLMRAYNLKNMIHIESDVMLYVDVQEILPTLQRFYPNIAAVADNDDRIIPSFFYVARSQNLIKLVRFMVGQGSDDMYGIGRYRKETYKSFEVGTLPIIHEAYVDDFAIGSSNKYLYCNQVEHFKSIFDAAYFGQYLGGIDPRNGDSSPGYINPDCVINSSYIQYAWERDRQGRLVPFAIYRGEKLRINNLHIHSKRLRNFYSLRAT